MRARRLMPLFVLLSIPALGVSTHAQTTGDPLTFSFLEPLADRPDDLAPFDPSAQPTVQILTLDATGTPDRVLASYTLRSGFGGEKLEIDTAAPSFEVVWFARQHVSFQKGAHHRVQVKLGALVLGHVDVALGETSAVVLGDELRFIDLDEPWSLPIVFHVGEGADDDIEDCLAVGTCVPVGCDGIAGSGKGYDICGACGGDATDSTECAPAEVEQCIELEDGGVVCQPPGDFVDVCVEELDECGVCGGDGSLCMDCDGVSGGSAEIDDCGVCGGDDSCIIIVATIASVAGAVGQGIVPSIQIVRINPFQGF